MIRLEPDDVEVLALLERGKPLATGGHTDAAADTVAHERANRLAMAGYALFLDDGRVAITVAGRAALRGTR